MLFVENARTAHTFDYKVILVKVKKHLKKTTIIFILLFLKKTF